MMTHRYTTFLFVLLCSFQAIVFADNDDIFSNLIIDTFGDLVIGRRYDDINVQFQYGLPDDFVSFTGLAGATVTGNSESMAVVSSGIAATGSAYIKSKRNLIYVPGHHGFVFFTAMFDTSAADSTQWIGLFDDNDGWAIGFDDTTFSILYRRDGVDTVINQSSFNTDTLDGNGPSGMTIDPTNLNVFRLGYGWLGGATITFSILRSDGEWFQFHEILRPNNFTGPSVINPVLPIQAAVNKTSGSTDLQLKTASWAAGRIGKRNPEYARVYSLILLDAVPDAAVESPMITIHNKATFKGKTNKTEVDIVFVGVSNQNARSRFTVIKNPTLTNVSYTDVDSNSVVEYDLFDDATQFPTYSSGTGDRYLTLLLDADGQTNIFPKGNDLVIKLLPGETATVTCNKQGAAGDIDVSLVWEELF